MTFNPDTDTNWATVVAALNVVNGAEQAAFMVAFIQWFCLQATTGGVTLNATAITNATAAGTYAAKTAGNGARNF